MKFFKIMEHVWLAAAVACFAFGLTEVFKPEEMGNDDYFLFLMGAICVTFYFARRKRRINMEKEMNKED